MTDGREFRFGVYWREDLSEEDATKRVEALFAEPERVVVDRYERHYESGWAEVRLEGWVSLR